MGMVVWEAKALQLLELAEDVKGKQSSFFSLQYHWKNKEEEVRPLLKRNRWPTDNWHSQGWGISSLLCLDFHQQSPIALVSHREEDLAEAEKNWVRDLLRNPSPCKSGGPAGMHLRVLRELADVMVRPLVIIFERSWRFGEVPSGEKKLSIAPMFKKSKDNPRGHRLVTSHSFLVGTIR